MEYEIAALKHHSIRFILALSLLCTPFAVRADEQQWNVVSLPPTFSGISSEDASAENLYVLAYIAQEMDEHLSRCPLHILNGKEAAYFTRKTVLKLTGLDEQKRFEQARKEGRSYIDTGSPPSRKTSGELSADFPHFSAGDRVSIRTVTPPKTDQPSVHSGSTAAELRLASQALNADALIISELELFRDAYILRTYIYTPADGSLAAAGEEVFSAGNLIRLSALFLDTAAAAGGYERSELSIEEGESPYRYRYTLNGAPVAWDSLSLKLIPPGEHLLGVKDTVSGFSETAVIHTAPDEVAVYRPQFHEKPHQEIAAAADYYQATVSDRASTQTSDMPALISAGQKLDGLLISAGEGYRSVHLSSDDTARESGSVRITVIPSWFDSGAEVLAAQKRFYTKLTTAVLALPIPIVLSGLADAHGDPAVKTALCFSLSVQTLLVLDTVTSLVDYYRGTGLL